MTSYAKPTSDEVDAVMPLLSSPQHEAYFFERLNNPNWVEPLLMAGAFAHPPRVVTVEGQGIRFPQWAPGKYLVRMASVAPAEVAAILTRVETKNSSVVGDIVRAAISMPPDIATALVPSIRRAATDGTLWIYFKDACDLCVHLARGGECDAALSLAESLFAPPFPAGIEENSGRDEYWYKEGLKKVVPVLAAQRPHEFLPLLCAWLQVAIDAKKLPQSNRDYSYLWRPAIEEHEANDDYEFAAVMAGFLREGCEVACRDGEVPLPEAIEILAQNTSNIFDRIAIHLIGEFGEHYPDLVKETILNRELFDDDSMEREYRRLLSCRFNLLSPEERENWLGWIDAGPDMSGVESWISETRGRDATEEDLQDWINRWQRERLHWVHEHLEGSRKEQYEKLIKKYGEPEVADVSARVSMGWGGLESPMTLEQLAGMTFRQAVGAITEWRPVESEFTGPSISGLATTFGQYVATNPEAFSEQADLLRNRPAIFVRTFITQMMESIKAGRDIDVASVFGLCNWVLEQPIEQRTIEPEWFDRPVDRDWEWTRTEICRLIDAVCTAEQGDALKFSVDEYREVVWGMISRLCHDRAESSIIHDPDATDPRVRDYLDFAINSPRGRAVEAALEYARWVGRQLKVAESDRTVVPGGFSAIPEVREMLEWQIAPENRTFVALAIIGSRIGLIYWIDKDWLAKNCDRLFSLNDIEEAPAEAAGWAAWNAFLMWVAPHPEFYRLFHAQFAYAVEQAATAKLERRSRHQPMYRLGEHLMVLYGRGAIELEADDSLLQQFILTANPDIRCTTIGFVGRNQHSAGDMPPEVCERFQTLWDFYWGGPGKQDAAEFPDEWLFGPWFAWGNFPQDWLLEQMHQFVQVNPKPQPDSQIAARLAETTLHDPGTTLKILDTIFRGDQHGWRVHSYREAALVILKVALESETAVREMGDRLIDFLGRRGYMEFGQLLDPDRPHVNTDQ